MEIMTFEEWRMKNQDLEDELREEFHPSGVTWGFLEDIGAEEASDRIEDELRVNYRQQVHKDQEAFKAWSDAVKECEQVGRGN